MQGRKAGQKEYTLAQSSGKASWSFRKLPLASALWDRPCAGDVWLACWSVASTLLFSSAPASDGLMAGSGGTCKGSPLRFDRGRSLGAASTEPSFALPAPQVP
jgi:hypothetical protein